MGKSMTAAAEQEAAVMTTTKEVHGSVTMEQYQAAVDAAAQCLAGRGIAAEIEPARGKFPPELGFAVRSMDDAARAEAAFADCKEMHLDGVASAWRAQTQPTREEADRSFRFLAACMARTAGMAAPTEAGPGDLAAWRSSADPTIRDAANSCVRKRQAEFGF